VNVLSEAKGGFDGRFPVRFARLFFRNPHAAADLDLGAQPVDGLALEAQRLTELARACEAYSRGDSSTAINKHSLITPNGFQ
jgi:hypothetical protein